MTFLSSNGKFMLPKGLPNHNNLQNNFLHMGLAPTLTSGPLTVSSSSWWSSSSSWSKADRWKYRRTPVVEWSDVEEVEVFVFWRHNRNSYSWLFNNVLLRLLRCCLHRAGHLIIGIITLSSRIARFKYQCLVGWPALSSVLMCCNLCPIWFCIDYVVNILSCVSIAGVNSFKTHPKILFMFWIKSLSITVEIRWSKSETLPFIDIHITIPTYPHIQHLMWQGPHVHRLFLKKST